MRAAPRVTSLLPWRNRYAVSDDSGMTANNISRAYARHYAQGRASLGHYSIVARFTKDGVMRVEEEFTAQRR
jgi:regulator of PEP synthase PpsR (kinase-PPPase family)